MAKDNKQSTEPVVSQLIKSREEVSQLLNDQIGAVGPILDMKVQGHEEIDYGPFGGRGSYWAYNEEQKEQFYAAYHNWDDFNREILTRSFEHPNNTYVQEYTNIGKVFFVSGHENFVEDTRKTIRKKVEYLNTLVSRLMLIPCKVEIEKNENINPMNTATKKPKIFISHSSKDKSFVEALVDLLTVLGLYEDNVVCTSVKGYGIPLNESIFDYLRKQFLDNELFIIFVHSPRFYESPVCLNEMGAAWALKADYCSFLTSDFDYPMMKGVVDSKRIAIKVADNENATTYLNELKDILVQLFDLRNPNQNVWEGRRDKFLQNVNSIPVSPSEEDVETIIEESKTLASGYGKPVPMAPNMNPAMNPPKELIVKYLTNFGEAKASTLSSAISVSIQTTQRLLLELVSEGRVVCEGNSKYGIYKVKK